MSGPLLSNELADMAESVKKATTRGKAASVEAAEAYIEAGRLLLDAKEACRHGEWLPFLARAEIHDRQARRMMALARSGFKSDTVSDIGIKAALDAVAGFEAIKREWDKAGPAARRRFLAWIAGRRR